ncbi:MAG: DPP IV N-terminal domain-containing protein [Phycisphaerales bacterium JB059]
MASTHHMSPKILAGSAGLALVLSGCASSTSTTSSKTHREEDPPIQLMEVAPSTRTTASTNNAASTNNTWVSPPTTPSRSASIPNASSGRAGGGSSGLSSNGWSDISDGWTMVGVATTAEASPPSRNADPYAGSAFKSHDPQNRELSVRLYGEELGENMPREVNPDALSRAVANMQQVTFSHEGADFDPNVSPDGRAIVFASTQHRPTSDIYIKAANSRVVTRLTEDVNQDVMPAISPDGQFVVFSSNRSGNWDLYMMPASGGKAVQLTNDDANELHPSWSPDGSKIVFSKLGQTSQRWEMWIVDVQNTTGAQFIGFGLFPEWCPVPGTGFQGADKIVFQRSRERGDRAFSIWTIEYNDSPAKAGRETEIMTSRTHALINPSWSPDGRFVLYAAVPNTESWNSGSSDRPETSSLWMIADDGRGRVKLTGGAAVDLMPVWGANGKVYFVSDRSGNENLWSFDIAPAVQAASAQIPEFQTGDMPYVEAPSTTD